MPSPGTSGISCCSASHPRRCQRDHCRCDVSPRLEALPSPQRALWPELAAVPRRYVLYGGSTRDSLGAIDLRSVPACSSPALRHHLYLIDGRLRPLTDIGLGAGAMSASSLAPCHSCP